MSERPDHLAMVTPPDVSIIVSSYNRPALLADALTSIEDQTFSGHVEVLVADDHSTADVGRVIGHMAERWRGQAVIRTIRPPGGAPTAQERQFGGRCAIGVNAALREASGTYLAFLPDDDYWPADSLVARVAALDAHPEWTVVYGRLEACKPDDGVAVPWGEPQQHGLRAWPGQRRRLRCGILYAGAMHFCEHDRDGYFTAEPVARGANHIDHGQVLVRRAGRRLPPWPEEPTCDPATGDWFDCPDAGWFYRLEVAGLGPFHPVDAVVIVKRYHRHGHRTDPSRRE